MLKILIIKIYFNAFHMKEMGDDFLRTGGYQPFSYVMQLIFKDRHCDMNPSTELVKRLASFLTQPAMRMIGIFSIT